VVDSSWSICGSDASCSNWRSLLSFVNSITNQLSIGNDNTRVGFVRYSSAGATTNPFYLNSHFSRLAVASAVSGVQYVTGGSFIGDLVNALQVARTQQFVSNRGDRVGAPNIIILLMNGGITVTSDAVSLQSFIILFYTLYPAHQDHKQTYEKEICTVGIWEKKNLSDSQERFPSSWFWGQISQKLKEFLLTVF